MSIFEVKYFVFGELAIAIVKADSEKTAIGLLKEKHKENFFGFDSIECLDSTDGILFSAFQ